MPSDSDPADVVAGVGESDDFVEDDDGALHAQNGGGYEQRQPEDGNDEDGGEGDEENPHVTGSPLVPMGMAAVALLQKRLTEHN